MASSLLTTDKRWAAPTRKSGMTVLGKIPKPINLPSQRLENHGLDPNVEIVPKGTLTWGGKTGSTTPNAWGSTSLLSPKKDGSSGAPSHITGRPSSGGGSRPSTAGSESLDSPNAWGPNSRPSSASGTLPSHHLPVLTNRPRSAETRPGSSQLSRFADNPSENMNASLRIIDKLGSSSHGKGFNLSTGDFPTLGSEKSSESNSQRGHSSKGRPTSSSGKEGAQNDLGKSLTTGEFIPSSSNQHVDIMKAGHHSHDGGASFPAIGPPTEVQRPQPYPPNYCMPPPQFDSWRAPPGHPPEGIWHRGPAGGGPFRPAPPGSYPIEPFNYCGQFPPNSEAARQGSGHDGYHPTNGDAYHTMPPNSYIMNQPVISVRPVYQGPLPYDGYYGPQRANFNNVNLRDSPFIGSPHQPGILNQFPNQNDKFQSGHSQSRPVKHEAVPKQLFESDRLHVVPRGQPRILQDNPSLLGGPLEVERKTQPAPPLLPHPDGNRNDVKMREDTRDTCSERNMVLMKSVPDQRSPAGTSHSAILENAHSHIRETDDATLQKKFKGDNVTFDQQPIIKKNAALIEKIGSLNNKARNVDACNVAEPFSSKEAKEKQQKNNDSKADKVIKDVSSDGAVVGPLHSHLSEVSKAGKLGESTHDRTRKRGDFSRNSHHGLAKDMPANNITEHARDENSKTESLPVVQLRNSQHDQPSDHASQLPPVTITDDLPATTEYDPQRAKMRELAVQRAKKLQAEEEERTKQQKAKALAKLEELNRRSSVHQKNSNDPPLEIDDVHNNKEKAELVATTKTATSTAESHDVTASDSLSTLQPSNDPTDTAVPVQSKSTTLLQAGGTAVHVQSKSTTLLHAGGTGKEPAVHNTSSSGRNTQSIRMEHVAQKSISQSYDVGVPKPKQGYRRRHAVSEEKIPGEKSSVSVSTDNVKKTVEASLDTSAAVVTSHDDPPAHKKSARNSRSKKKVDDAPATSKYPPMVLNEQKPASISNEQKTQTAGVIISSSIVPTEGTMLTVGSITVGGITFGSLNQVSVQSPEDAHNTANVRPRAPQAKRSGKNQHAVRPVEKPLGNEGVVWAPVKPSGQNDQSEEAMLKAAVAPRTQAVGKNTNDGENVTRTKRAEMERYVPKPLSKELQQQNLEQNLLSVENKSNDKEEAAEKLAAPKADAATEAKKWEDKKTSRGHGKSHPSWRRRNTDESDLVVSNPAERAENYQDAQEVRKPSDQHQPLEPDKQADYATGNCSAPTQTVPLPVSDTKEHGAANRQRRQHVKAPKIMGSNYPTENKDREGRKEAHQMSTASMDSNSSENRNVSRHEAKSSGAVAHSRAHWKPKASHSQNNPQDNNTAERQVDNATLHDSNLTPSSNVNVEKDAQCGQVKGDMMHGDDNQKSEGHENAEQQQLNPAAWRQSHHNGRYHRGSATQRGRGYDAGKSSHGANAERRKGGTHLEYQPVGSYNKTADFQQNPSVDEQSAGPPAQGQAYRERDHNRGPRPAGPFVKRNPASAPAANSYRDE